MINLVVHRCCCVFLCCLLWACFSYGVADESLPEQAAKFKTSQLLEIQQALTSATAELQALKKASAKFTEQQEPDLFAELRKQSELVSNLQLSMEKTATGGLTIEAINVTEPPFDWRQEMANITKPIIESLKKLTNKPRQTAELQNNIKRINTQHQVLEKGLAAITRENEQTKDAVLTASLDEIQKDWQQQLASLAREKTVLESQLQALNDDTPGWWESLGKSLESFFAGRALTLLLAIIVAVGVWLMFRILNRNLWRYHSARRGSPLYRFFMYSFHAFSTVFMVLMVFAVFYLRDDVLLLGLGMILLIGGFISMQRALPRFLKEVNLLLNLGSAREGERVIYNGVPYRVQALNVFTILSNPALSGIHRLPLEQLAGLFSRPILTEEIWFPSEKGDVLMMLDDTLVIVEQQSVEQVILKSIGGAIIQYNTAAFLELNLINLSRSGNFVVSTVFGLDYQYQDSILEDYPTLIQAEIPKALAASGISPDLYQDILVEFKTANASSLDLLICTTFDSQLAIRFNKLERVLQQACLTVCNKHNLTIPFPQLSIHVENNAV